jgi:hypothetical protein
MSKSDSLLSSQQASMRVRREEVSDLRTRLKSGHNRVKPKMPESTYRRLRYQLSTTWLRTPLVRFRHCGFRSADVFFAAYPRSGSTWSRFTLFEMLTGQDASFENVNTTLRGVGAHSRSLPVLPGGGRLIGTHESYRPAYKRAVYLVRDGRDVLLSEYLYLKALGRFGGELDKFVAAFVHGKVNGFGAWPAHVSSWLDSPIAGTSNMLLVRFEDLRSNPEMVFRGIIEFLGAEVKPEILRKAIANNSLEQMRAKEDRSPQKASVGGRFVRNGCLQQWRTGLSPRQLQMIEQVARDSLFRLGYPVSSPAERDFIAATGQASKLARLPEKMQL